MERTVTGFFPTDEGAAAAVATLQEAGFTVRHSDTASQAVEYDRSQAPQGHIPVTVEPGGNEAEARSILMRTGAVSLQGHGVTGTPTGMSALIDEEAPIPVQHGERALDPREQAEMGTDATGTDYHSRTHMPEDARQIDMLRDAADVKGSGKDMGEVARDTGRVVGP
jgi:hypothetical protein